MRESAFIHLSKKRGLSLSQLVSGPLQRPTEESVRVRGSLVYNRAKAAARSFDAGPKTLRTLIHSFSSAMAAPAPESLPTPRGAHLEMMAAVLAGDGLGRVAEIAAKHAGSPVAVVVPRIGVPVEEWAP
jgi:hypothetical protein